VDEGHKYIRSKDVTTQDIDVIVMYVRTLNWGPKHWFMNFILV